MQRLIPLGKVVLWMVMVYTVASVLLSLLYVYVNEADKPEPTPTVFITQFLEKEIGHGVLSGVLTGLAMALYAGVDRWTIQKLARFRLALFAVAAVVSVLYVGGSFHIAHLKLYGVSLFELIAMAVKHPVIIAEPTTAMLIWGTIAKYLAIGFMSVYVAGKYWREASPPSQASLESADEPLKHRAESV